MGIYTFSQRNLPIQINQFDDALDIAFLVVVSISMAFDVYYSSRNLIIPMIFYRQLTK